MEWNGTHYETVTEEGYDYAGEWELCKESDQEKQQRIQMQNLQFQAAQNYYNVDQPFQRQIAQQQQDMYMKQLALQQEYQTQYQKMQQDQFNWEKQQTADALQRQQDWLAPIKASMTPYLTGDAYTPADVSRATDAAISNVASGYSDAAGNTRAALLSRGGGGDMPVGGDYIRGNADLEAALANQTSTARRDVATDYANRNLQAKFAAAGVLAGGGAQMGGNVGTFNSGTANAAQGFGAGANTFATAPVTSLPGVPAMLAPPKPPSMWGQIGSSLLGSAANVGLGFATGGLSNMFSSWFKGNPTSSPVGAGASNNFGQFGYGVGSGYQPF